MARFTHLLSISLILVFLPACSVYIGAPMSWKTRKIPVPEGDLAPAISTTSNIAFSSDRNSSLAALAANPKLNPEEQLYLLAIVKRLGGFSSGKADVLVALAKNPAVTPQARREISELVPKLSLFSSDVARVATALGE